MKRQLLTIFVIGILASLQGMVYFGVGKMMEESSHTCPISIVMSSGCVNDFGTASTIHHITVIKGMTQANIVDSALTPVLAVVALILFVLIPTLSRRFFFLSELSVPVHRSRWKDILFSSRKKIMKWISLHNKCSAGLIFGRI